jgi:hypothetical protein
MHFQIALQNTYASLPIFVLPIFVCVWERERVKDGLCLLDSWGHKSLTPQNLESFLSLSSHSDARTSKQATTDTTGLGLRCKDGCGVWAQGPLPRSLHRMSLGLVTHQLYEILPSKTGGGFSSILGIWLLCDRRGGTSWGLELSLPQALSSRPRPLRGRGGGWFWIDCRGILHP